MSTYEVPMLQKHAVEFLLGHNGDTEPDDDVAQAISRGSKQVRYVKMKSLHHLQSSQTCSISRMPQSFFRKNSSF